jgi:hypothetical protein
MTDLLDTDAPFSMDVELSGSTRVIGKIEWLSDSFKKIATIEPYVGKKSAAGSCNIACWLLLRLKLVGL